VNGTLYFRSRLLTLLTCDQNGANHPPRSFTFYTRLHLTREWKASLPTSTRLLVDSHIICTTSAPITTMNEQVFCLAICTLVSRANVSREQIFKLRDSGALQALQILGQYTTEDFNAYYQQYFPWVQQQDATSTPMSMQTRHLSSTSPLQSRPPSDCFSQSSRPSRGSTWTELNTNLSFRQAAGQFYDSYSSNGSSLAPVDEGQNWLSVNDDFIHPAPITNLFYPSQADDTFSDLHSVSAASRYPHSVNPNNMSTMASFANVRASSSISPYSASRMQDAILSPAPTQTMSPTRIAPAPRWSNIVPRWTESPAAKAASPTLAFDERKKIFCPIGDCSREYCGKTELAKHVRADHEKCDTFTCQHIDCELPFKKDSDWKSHHTKGHSQCIPSTLADCRIHQELPRRKNWGCGFCERHFHGLSDWVDHFVDHVKNDRARKSDFDFSVLVRSLLSQPAVKPHWNDHLREVGFANGMPFQWREEAKETQVLLDDLKWGRFRGESLLEPGKAEEVVQYAVSLAQVVSMPTNVYAQQPFFQEFS
jgi:hypothetical protein